MPCQRGDLARCVGEEARVVCRGDLARARCAAAALRLEGARGTGDCDGKVNVWPRGLLTVALGGVWQRGTSRRQKARAANCRGGHAVHLAPRGSKAVYFFNDLPAIS